MSKHTKLPQLGVCYYPEHWHQSLWAEDAQKMRECGLSLVRIGEFAWSQIEPQQNELHWQWLDEAIDTLAAAGLDIVLGTSTATPPRWLVDKHPDMYSVDEYGRQRIFGSRRHYCFSYLPYHQEAARIVELMAQRYGDDERIVAWQIDNEYGCHQTVRSYSQAAKVGFQQWLRRKYHTIASLNEAWGNIFWSMAYQHFEQIDLPNNTVADANPTHLLDFYRYSSEQVVVFNRMQVDIIRQYTQCPVLHNYMGGVTDFDHFAVADNLNIAAWDSYPLGFLTDRIDASDDNKIRYAQQGDADYQAFHHDLCRALGKDGWWVMEQQPGVVNWGLWNTAPLSGMLRLWTIEAMAHGAQAVCYFRWRQLPFAQEQMHAGLLLSNNQPASAYDEVKAFGQEIMQIMADGKNCFVKQQAAVAIVFDYVSAWAWQIEKHAKDFDYFALVFSYYQTLRQLGLSVDILPPNVTDFGNRRCVFIPALMAWNDSLKQAINQFEGVIVVGPRSGAKTQDFHIPPDLAPNINQIGSRVVQPCALRPGITIELEGGGYVQHWLELLDYHPDDIVLEQTVNQQPVVIKQHNFYYVTACLDTTALRRVFTNVLQSQQLKLVNLPNGLRRRACVGLTLYTNYNNEAVEFEGKQIPACGVVIEENN